MNEPRKGWSWFDRDGDAGNGRQFSNDTAVSELRDPGRDLRLAYARCFSSADGKRVLEHLRAITLERAFGPDVLADTLRHVEGQRQLVSFMAALTDRGRTGG